MTTFFTSDTHLGHKNIIDFCRRPFHSVDNMNKLLVMQWNEVVTDDDDVWVLGDFAMGQIAETLPLAQQLRGRNKYLVPGNHDRCWPYHSRAATISTVVSGGLTVDAFNRIDERTAQWKQKYEEVGFTVMPTEVEWTAPDGETFLLCHFPVTGDSHDIDRYSEQRPQLNGRRLLHGHTHSHQCTFDGVQFNVGVDAHGYYPATLEQILAHE